MASNGAFKILYGRTRDDIEKPQMAGKELIFSSGELRTIPPKTALAVNTGIIPILPPDFYLKVMGIPMLHNWHNVVIQKSFIDEESKSIHLLVYNGGEFSFFIDCYMPMAIAIPTLNSLIELEEIPKEKLESYMKTRPDFTAYKQLASYFIPLEEQETSPVPSLLFNTKEEFEATSQIGIDPNRQPELVKAIKSSVKAESPVSPAQGMDVTSTSITEMTVKEKEPTSDLSAKDVLPMETEEDYSTRIQKYREDLKRLMDDSDDESTCSSKRITNKNKFI